MTALLFIMIVFLIFIHFYEMWLFDIASYKICYNKHRVSLICLLIYYIQAHGLTDIECSQLFIQYTVYREYGHHITFKIFVFQLFLQYALMVHDQALNEEYPEIGHCLQWLIKDGLLTIFASFAASPTDIGYSIPIIISIFIWILFNEYILFLMNAIILLSVYIYIQQKYKINSLILLIPIFCWCHFMDYDVAKANDTKIFCLIYFCFGKIPLIFDPQIFTVKQWDDRIKLNRQRKRLQVLQKQNKVNLVDKYNNLQIKYRCLKERNYEINVGNDELNKKYNVKIKQLNVANECITNNKMQIMTKNNEINEWKDRFKTQQDIVQNYQNKINALRMNTKHQDEKYKNKYSKSRYQLNETQKLCDDLKQQIKAIINESNNKINALQQNLNCVQNELNQTVKMLNMEVAEKENLEKIRNDKKRIYELKFEFWLNDIVKLSEYLHAFKQNKCNDIRMIQFFGKHFIRNDIKIHNKMHCKLLVKESKKFKAEQMEFERILSSNLGLKQYTHFLYKNGILTLQHLLDDISSKQKLCKMLNVGNNDKENDLWQCIEEIKGEDNKECVVCMDSKRSFVCIPCGHVVLCKMCKDLVNEQCPICQIKCSIYKLYHS